MNKKRGKAPPDKEITEELSKNLKSLIPTNEWLADKVGISSQAVADYVNGISIPRGDILLKISKAVGKSIEELLTNKEETTSVIAEPHAPYKTGKSPPVKISEFLAQTAAVLESNSIYSEALKNNIHAFYTAVTTEPTEPKKERDPQRGAQGSGSQTRKKKSA